MTREDFKQKRGPVGHGDLLRLRLAFPQVSAQDLGRLLNYVVDSSRQDSITGKNRIDVQLPVITAKVFISNSHQNSPEVSFWHITEQTITGGDAEGAAHAHDFGEVPEQLPKLKRSAPEPHVPLQPWSRLWPLLRDRLAQTLASRQPDDAQVVRRLARGEALSYIPRRIRRVWPRTLLLAEDNGVRLFPFWGDFASIRESLQRTLPANALHICRVASGPLRQAIFFGASRLHSLEQASADQAVLIFSDLGHYDDAAWLRQEWLDYGRKMLARGIRPVVLTPVPRRCWHPDWSVYFHMLCWDDTPSGIVSQEEENRLVDRLLALASPAVRVEPRLLRALRGLLHGADSGIEAKVWNHADVESTYLAYSYRREKHQEYRAAFLKEPSELQRQALIIIARQHRFLPSEVRLEERLSAFALRCHTEKNLCLSKVLRNYVAWLSQCLRNDSTGRIQPWVRRMGWRQVPWIKTVPGAESIGCSVAKAFSGGFAGENEQDRPEWIDDEDIAMARGEAITICRWQLWQVGQRLLVTPNTQNAFGCLLGELPGRSLLRITDDGHSTSWAVGSGLEYPLPETGMLVLATQDARLQLATMPKPEWAESIAMKKDGLYATLPLNDSVIQWMNPHSSAIPNFFTVGPHENGQEGISAKQVGGWFNHTVASRIADNLPDISWANRHGFDQYGLYAEFDFKGITQRMRWIMPGTFMMGSPKKEVDRENDETQHKVTLSHGFWLADTTCTQELWQAVMRENLSHFKGQKELPVENVTWNMCQEFCSRINKVVPSLQLRLPTEAQWEYACRAGTVTPFSFGDNITTEHVNFDGDNPYNNASKGVYREQTVAVRALPCNQWGLYQMHGNVWEWCAAWSGKYASGPVTDPEGLQKSEVHVLRGGGWFDDGGAVRSAFRLRFDPGSRYINTGFRFSRGHKG